VLVVEDEMLVALDIEFMLARLGWRVLGPAPTVTLALRLLTAERPDVALLDFNLRGEVVTPVAAALQRLNVPFVLSSAYDGREIEGIEMLARAPRVGKPVPEQRLIAALEQAARGE
jgi:two-component SAPR family response regulator